MSELWPTIVTASVSAVATVALVISTIAFYRWAWRQRNPRPVYLSGYIERETARPHTFTIRLALGNTGDVPMIIAGAVVRLCFKSSCFTTLTFKVIVEDPETGKGFSACSIPARRAARVTYDVDISQMKGNLTATKGKLPDRVDLAIMGISISGSTTSQPTVYRCTLTFILPEGKGLLSLRSRMWRMRRLVRECFLPRFVRGFIKDLRKTSSITQ